MKTHVGAITFAHLFSQVASTITCFFDFLSNLTQMKVKYVKFYPFRT